MRASVELMTACVGICKCPQDAGTHTVYIRGISIWDACVHGRAQVTVQSLALTLQSQLQSRSAGPKEVVPRAVMFTTTVSHDVTSRSALHERSQS